MINCNQLTGDIENIIATLRIMNQQMTVMRDDENYLLDVNNISYIEAVERKTFVYTEDAIYESKLKLYEMEDRLCQSGFFRVSKSCLVHLKFIKSLKNDIDRNSDFNIIPDNLTQEDVNNTQMLIPSGGTTNWMYILKKKIYTL